MNELKTEINLNIDSYRKAKHDKENELINKLLNENIDRINAYILEEAKTAKNIEEGSVEISYRRLFDLAGLEYEDFKLPNRKIREIENSLYKYFMKCGFKGTLLYRLDHYCLFFVSILFDQPCSYYWIISLKI